MPENDLAKKIRDLRASNKLTLEQVAQVVGVGRSTVRKWETGMIANMRRDKIEKLAIALHTTPAYLMGWEEQSETDNIPENVRPVATMQKIPLIGQIACGTPILAEENIADYVDLPNHIRADFALTCKGDSMINAGIRDGDVVYIRKQEQVDNGQIAAVRVGEEEATLKRFYFDGQTVTLVAENPAIPPMVYPGEAAAGIHIIGLAVAYTHAIYGNP